MQTIYATDLLPKLGPKKRLLTLAVATCSFVLISVAHAQIFSSDEDEAPPSAAAGAAGAMDRMKQLESDAEAAYLQGAGVQAQGGALGQMPPTTGMPLAPPYDPSALMTPPPYGSPPPMMNPPMQPMQMPMQMMPQPSMSPPPYGSPPPMMNPPIASPQYAPTPMMVEPTPRAQVPASSSNYQPYAQPPVMQGMPAYQPSVVGVVRPTQDPRMSPLIQERQGEVVFDSPQTNTIREQQMDARAAYVPSEAEKMKYRPLANDATVDPLDKGFENWLKNIRGKNPHPIDIDEYYEKFVRNISPLLFSLGEKRLSLESKAMFDKIPADSLSAVGRLLEPKNPVDIARGVETKDPFPKPDPNVPVDQTIGEEVGLNIQVKPANVTVQKSLEMGYDALRSGQIEGAIAIYKGVLVQEPDNRDGLFGLATAYHRGSQLPQAREVYIQLLEKDPNNWPALNNFLVLAGDEAPQDALKQLKKLEQINPEFGPLAAQIGMIYAQMGQVENAVKYLSRAIILSPDNLAYRYNLAVILDHGGYKQQAARLYAQILDANSTMDQQLPESRDKIRDRLAFITSTQNYRQ